MLRIQFSKSRRILLAFMVMWAITLAPFGSALAADAKKPQGVPLTTKNPNISLEELDYRLEPLTKDDLSVEADGWQEVLKNHVGKVSKVQVLALKAEGDKKTKLLESVTDLQEQQTALADRFVLVIEAFKAKGGKVEDYEAYIKAISGVEVDISDASATWTVVAGWLASAEGGLRWAKNISMFFVILLISWFLAKLQEKLW